MNRFLAFVATGLCAAIATALLPSGGGGSDQAIGRGYAGMAGGIALAAAGFFALGWAAQRFVPAHRVRYLLAADAVLLVVGIVAWRGMLAPDPVLEYAEGRGVLQVEARLPRARHGADPIEEIVSIGFAGGTDLSDPHPERRRDEGDAVILPWETTPMRVRAWDIDVIVRGQPVRFTLPLPKVPASSAEWSAWTSPQADQGSLHARGLTLRYRFLVIPFGQ
jgi:hypothetical protein